MMEAAVVLDLSWQPIRFHVPAERTGGSLPDSHDLWTVLWENRRRLLGVAHSHPGGGVPAPSHTDLTTFAAVENGLGVRLVWPIVTQDAVSVFAWRGPGPLAYAPAPGSLPADKRSWVAELLRLSR